MKLDLYVFSREIKTKKLKLFIYYIIYLREYFNIYKKKCAKQLQLITYF